MICDFQQCGILISAASFSSHVWLIVLESEKMQATNKSYDQTVRMGRLV